MQEFAGRNVRIGKFVSLEDCIIADGVKIEDGARIYEGCEIGEGSIIGPNAVLRPRTKIGKYSIFGTLSCCEGYTEIGDYSTIHAQCHITKGMKIGNNVFIGPCFTSTNTPKITTGKHGSKPGFCAEIVQTIIDDNVRIGGSVNITPGCRIGNNSIINQDCFINQDIPPFSYVKKDSSKVDVIIERLRA